VRGVARALAVLAALLWVAAAGRDAADRWIDGTRIASLAPATGAEVRARDGALLRAYQVENGRWRLAVDPEAVDPFYLALLLETEDRRFHDHAGVDPRALLRAAWQAALNGRVVSGGSTISMQVARLIEGTGTGRIAGKLRQIRVALALERRLGKRDILGLYLHLAPFGGNVEGVRAASLAWFGREPARLTPAQAALLVALPQAPEARRPDRDPAAAGRARDRLLARAAAAGLIDAETAAAAMGEGLPRARQPFPTLAPHLADRLTAEQTGRLPVATTIDAGLQARLESLAADAVAGSGERVQIAILVADHATGEVLASVGSPGYAGGPRQGFLDMTTALRSPGSTLKPLVYALAFDEGLAHPETLIDDRPTAFGTYAPTNFDGAFRGTIRVREALEQSLNVPVVALTEALGPERLMAGMRRAGARPALPGGGRPGLAVALGGVGLSLGDLVAIYAALARGGEGVALSPLAEAAGGTGAQVVSANAAWAVGDILAGLAPPPGAGSARIAYKTGTSYGHRDALAIGFDGRHVAGVWMGRADGTPVPGAFGAETAAPVLFRVFGSMKAAPDPLPAPPPGMLTVATADLPPPLQRFRPRGGRGAAAADAPEVAFPPAGASVAIDEGTLLLRVRQGVAPFTWLANGAPLIVGTAEREVVISEGLSPGRLTLSVIDAEGRSDRVQVRLVP
jgi:penicillin-binding protein 1C